MGRPGGKHPTEYETEMMKTYSAAVRKIFEIEKMSLVTLFSLTGLSTKAVHGVKTGAAYITTLVKVADAMGYEVAFIKTKQRKKITDDIEAMNRRAVAKKSNQRGYKKYAAKRKSKPKKQSGLSQSELRSIQQSKGEF